MKKYSALYFTSAVMLALSSTIFGLYIYDVNSYNGEGGANIGLAILTGFGFLLGIAGSLLLIAASALGIVAHVKHRKKESAVKVRQEQVRQLVLNSDEKLEDALTTLRLAKPVRTSRKELLSTASIVSNDPRTLMELREETRDNDYVLIISWWGAETPALDREIQEAVRTVELKYGKSQEAS